MLALFATGTAVWLSVGSHTVLAQQSTRVWTDDSGTFSVKATLLKINESSVSLKKLNGVEIEVPFDRLSKFDIEFVEKLKEKPKPSSDPLPTEPEDQTKPAPAASQAIASKIENPAVLPESPFPKIFPAAGNRPGEKKSIPDYDALSKPDNSNVVQTSLPELVDPLAETGLKLVVDPLSLEVSSKDIEGMSAPYRTMAWQISNINNRESVRAGLESLGSDWPKQEIPTLFKLLKRLTGSSEAKTRKQAVDLLAQHDAKESLGYILAGTEDKNFFVRWACYEWIEKLRDKRAIAPLIKKLESDDPDLAATTLVSFGAAAESQVLPLINHESSRVQMTACSLLAKIGSSNSIVPLESLAKNASLVKVRMQANNAIEQIKKRRQQAD